MDRGDGSPARCRRGHLKHNVEIQDRLVKRLKNIPEFQGAYYELIVANVLIRAGFELELEDETIGEQKHCEFSARSKKTGTLYWVEAKSRSVAGVLGKTDDNGTKSKDATNRMVPHIRNAFSKPADGPRLIFVDLNAEHSLDHTNPVWFNQMIRRLEASEKNRTPDEVAYVFVTNLPHHRYLDEYPVWFSIFPFGYGIGDFFKPAEYRLSDHYRHKMKHIDAHTILEFFQKHPQIPETFDGRPASDGTGDSRIRVGETYHFEGAGIDERDIGTVTSVAVLEKEREMAIAVSTPDGKGCILKGKMSEREFEDYKKYGDAYFGEPKQRQFQSETIFELYEFFVESYREASRETLLRLAGNRPDLEELKKLSDFDLLLEVCEAMAASADRRANSERTAQ